MRIEEELKLDYSDVLFRPKRSTLKSRKDVNLLRTYRFKYSKNEWSGIPIMAANMDGVGELSIAEKKEDKLTNNRNGNVILVSSTAKLNFISSSKKPGAIKYTK